MKPSNTSVADSMRQEAEMLAQHTPSATAKDFTNEEAILQIQKLESRVAELELENEGLSQTIEYQKQKKTTLRKNDSLLQSIVQTIPDLIWLKDVSGVYIACNSMFERFFGAKEVDIIGKTDYDYVDKELADFFRDHDKMAMEAGTPTINEEWITFADDGHRAFLETIKTPMYDENQKLIGILGIGRDITLRKEAETKLNEKEVQYQNLANSGLALVWTSGTDKLCNYFNQTWLHFTGRTLEQEIGNGWAEGVLQEDFDLCLSTYLTAFDKREPFQMEYRLRHHSGTYRWILDMGTPNYNKDGEFIGYIGNCFDIDERKQIENALTLERNKLVAALDNVSIGFVICNGQGGDLTMNETARRFHDFASPDEVIQNVEGYENDWELRYANGQLMDYNQWPLARAINGDFVSNFEIYYTNLRTGRKWICNLTSMPVKNSANEITLIVQTLLDITEAKQLEADLKLSEMKFKNVFNYSMVGKSLTTLNGELNTNQAFEEIIGYSKEELNSALWKDITFQEDIQHNAELLKKVLSGELNSARLEKRFIHKNGNLVWVDLSTTLLRDANNDPLFYITEIIDITDQKNTQFALQESNNRLNLILQNSPIAIWDWDLETDKWFATQKYYTMLGYEPESGNPDRNLWLNRIHPDDREQVKIKIENVRQHKAEAYSYDARMLHADGSYRWHSVIGHVVERDEEGKTKRMLGVRIDINERKAVEEKLKESEGKLSTLFASMTEMVVMHDLVFDEEGDAINYRITDCNKAFTNITNIKREDAIGKLATDVYGTINAPYLEQYTHVAITGESKEFDSYFAPMDKHFLISAISPEKNKFATISSDVTALQQIQQQISMKNKELEDYLYIASHDLRSPLVNIQGFSQRLQKQTEKITSQLGDCEIDPIIKTDIAKITTEEIPKTLDFIYTSVSKMETLISGLLQLSRTGRVKISIGRVDMNKLIKTILEAHNYQISNLAPHITVEDLPDCYGDEQQLNQLFSNLISNAIKYRNRDRNFEIKIKAINSFNRVIYSITDNGIGIPPKFHEKIWNIFYRIHPQSQISGDGMGLSFVKQIAEKHHGKAWVESDEGQGSTFFIELQKNNWE